MENDNLNLSGNGGGQPASEQDKKFTEEPQKSWINEYYEAVKAGLLRVWLNRYLWFWGILLPASFGMNLNYNLAEKQNFENQASLQSAFLQLRSFVSENLAWLVLGIVVFFVLGILLWLLSAIARSGVIKALNQLQNPAEANTFSFGQVWIRGKEGFTQILLVDFFIGMSMILIMLILSAPVIILLLRQQFAFAGMLGILAMIIYIPILILSYFLRTIGSVFCSLSKMKAGSAIELAYDYVWIDFRETLKMILAMLGLGLFQNIVFVAGIFAIAVAGGVVGLFFSFIFGFDAVFGAQNKVLFGTLAGIFGIAIIAAAVFMKSFFSLWFQDLWVWWIKRVGVLRDAKEKEKEIGLKEQVKGEVITGIE